VGDPPPSGASVANQERTMAKGFGHHPTAVGAVSAIDGSAITPSDDEDLPDGPCRGIYVGGAGTVVLVTAPSAASPSGTTLTFINNAAGSILPVVAARVMLATTATNLIALY
jgi:hypothetical protein